MIKAKKKRGPKGASTKRKRLKKKILRQAQNLRFAKRRKVLVVKPKTKKNRRVIKRKRKVEIKPRKKIVMKKRVKNLARSRKIISKKTLQLRSRQRRGSPKAARQVKRIVFHKTKKHIVKKWSREHPVERFPAESLFKAKIKVIGIGGGGGSIVSEIGRSLEKATFVIADTDIRALKKKSGIKYFWFGEELTHGLGTGVNVELAKQAAELAKEKISGFFKDQDIIIFVASLGGGLGSGATQVFAEAAKEFGGITFGIFTMPFKFEGKNKHRIAQNALKSLRKSLNVSLVIPNEKIFKIIDEATPITNAFSTVNKSLIESLESLIDLIYNPGIINIDFADLRTILNGRGNSAFLNTIEESGKDRVEKICEKIFKNPLLQNSSFKAEKILFNIAGSENLPMFEVEKISSHIANLNPKAKIIFGISKNFKLKNKIKTTILMTGGNTGLQIKENNLVKKTESIKLASPEKIKKLVKKEKGYLLMSHVKKDPSASLRASNKKSKAPKSKKPVLPNKNGQKPVSFIPVFETPAPSGHAAVLPVLEQKKIEINQTALGPERYPSKKTIRRSGLEIKKAEELEEKKKIAQEKEWEIPAFLRKVKLR